MISARFMHENFFDFRPTHKLVVVGNHAPTIGSVDDALRRRLHLVPFNQKPKVLDLKLGERLRAEAPGVLAWMLAGFKEWELKGLAPPALVINATKAYFEEQDTVGGWLAECCELQPTAWLPSNDLFESWKRYCEQNGVAPKSMKRLAPELERRGLSPQRTSTARGFRGVKLTSMTGHDALMTHRRNRGSTFPSRETRGNDAYDAYDTSS